MQDCSLSYLLIIQYWVEIDDKMAKEERKTAAEIVDLSKLENWESFY